MKGKNRRAGRKNMQPVQLQKMMNSVDQFVRSKSESRAADELRDYTTVKKKSRKELRKEKRKLKKAKMKLHYQGKKEFSESLASVGTSKAQPRSGENKKTKSILKKDTDDTEKRSSVSETGQVKKRVRLDEGDPQQGSKRKNSMQENRKKALLEANEQEDREIRKLERCLGFHKRKNKKNLPKSFTTDGLDYILGVLDAGAAGMYDSNEGMDVKDRLEELAEEDESMQEEEDDDDDDGDDDVEEEEEESMSERSHGEEEEEDGDDDNESNIGERKVVDEMDVTEEEEGGEEAEEEEENTGGEKDAGGPKTPHAPTKYVPPYLREAEGSKRKAELVRLTRTVKGLINRLSEPNMASISGQLEELYMSHSRKDMNDTLTDILLAGCVSSALTPDRLLMEHMLLISVLHHNVGLEVGAHFLETVVRRFEEVYREPASGKECDNLLAIVAHLYNFQVVHSLLVFDILRRLASTFAEKDIELILFLLKNVGFSLRKDDASSLRELINEVQHKAAALGAQFRDQTRVRFMLETMMALKNNNMRKIPGYDPEPVERLRKLQRTLVRQSSQGGDMKLRTSLDNLLAAEQVGRWWIVGSSWSGAPMIEEIGGKQEPRAPVGQFSAKVLELARKQRMNTEIRRNIFCVIMTSEDYLDAFEKLLRLGLKEQQEREIVHVLLDCCLQEKLFNAFYAVLADKLCAHDRRFQMTLQFSLWDKFKELQSLSSNTFANLIQLLVHLLQKKTFSLSILKVIEFGELDKVKVRFLRQVLRTLLQETEHEDLADIFARISGIPKLVMLREGLKLFISHFLLRNMPSEEKPELAQQLVKAADIATKALVAKDAKLKL